MQERIQAATRALKEGRHAQAQALCLVRGGAPVGTPLRPRPPGCRFHHDPPALCGGLRRSGQMEEATGVLSRLLQQQPSLVQGWYLLGKIRESQERNEEAIRCWEKVVQVDPVHLLATLEMVRLRGRQNQTEAARQCLEQGIQRFRKHKAPLGMLKLERLLVIPMAFESVASQERWRRQYVQGLKELEETSGQMVETVYPAVRRPLPPPPRRERIRVGFASIHLHTHTITRLFRGWIEGLDRARFEVGLYPLGTVDAMTAALPGCQHPSVPRKMDPPSILSAAVR